MPKFLDFPMENQIEVFQTADNQTEVNVKFDKDTVWLSRHQLAELFDRDIKTIGKHINNVFSEGELKAAEQSHLSVICHVLIKTME